MPYKLRKARGKDLYWVITKDTGKKHSKDPMPLERAKAQMRALYVHLPQEGGGFFGDVWNAVGDKVDMIKRDWKDRGMATLTGTNYTGAFNRLDDEYLRTHPPTDIIDEGALAHDLEYSRLAKLRKEGKTSKEDLDRMIRESDEKFLQNIRDNWTANPWAGALGYAGIRGKNKLEDEAGLDRNLFVGEGLPKGMKLSVLHGSGKIAADPKHLNMFEFFKGTGSIGKVAKRLGFNVVSLDLESKYTPDIEANILHWDYKKWAEENKFVPDYIWASPPCNTFSVIAYRFKERNTKTAVPTSDRAKEGTAILHKTIEIIKYFQSKNPKLLYTIENPRGMMRHDAEIKKLPNRETTLYSLYGDFKHKPTDFWSNFPMNLRPHTEKVNRKGVVANLTNLPTIEQRYSIPSKLVKAILTRAKEDYGSEPVMKGSGFFGDLWNSARTAFHVVKNNVSNVVSSISNVVSGTAPRKNLSPMVRRVLADDGNKPIIELFVRREPIQSGLNTALNVISLGKWDDLRKKYSYDKFFHLQLECVVAVSPTTQHRFTIEKNAVIEIHNASPLNKDSETMPVPFHRPLTMNDLIEGAKRVMGDKFLYYDAFRCNCQDFVMGLLTGSGLGNPQIYSFVKQPIDTLVEEVPSWTSRIARALTDLGGIADVAQHGQGVSKPMPRLLKQLHEWRVNPMDYLAVAKKKAHEQGLADNMLSFSTDEKHKFQIPNVDGKIIRFGAVGLGDYLLYSLIHDPKKEQHRDNYRKRATKIKGDWAKDPYSPNSLAIGVLW